MITEIMKSFQKSSLLHKHKIPQMAANIFSYLFVLKGSLQFIQAAGNSKPSIVLLRSAESVCISLYVCVYVGVNGLLCACMLKCVYFNVQ